MGLLSLRQIKDVSRMVKDGDVIIFRRLVRASDDDAASSPKHMDSTRKHLFEKIAKTL